MRSRIRLVVAALGWMAGAAVIVALARMPGRNLDLYFHDRYFVVSKGILYAVVLLLMMLPPAIRRLRAPNR